VATYRGQEGFIALSASTVGEIKTFDVSLRQDSLDVSVMGDEFKRVRGGLKHGSGRASAQFDYGDASQKALVDNIVSDPGTTLATARFHIDGTKYIEGDILITEASPKGAYNTIFMLDLTFDFSGQYTVSWL
jgi:hypothetical protein